MQVEALAEGSAMVSGEECGCELAPVLRRRKEVATTIAESTASLLVHVCAGKPTSP